jgi:hypothetical protein
VTSGHAGTPARRRRILTALGGMACLLATLLAVDVPTSGAADVPLVSFGSAWRYLDNGSNQGTAWRSPTFVDTAWRSGPAQLGYGDGDERTVVSYVPYAAA